MPQYDDRLKDYVDVKERIRLFYEKFPTGSIVTTKVWLMHAADGEYICVKAKAYRTPDDPRPTTGVSWLRVPGTTPYTKGSELENTQTSAWGRAIGALGIGIEKSIASANEIANKETVAADVEHTNDGGLIGTVQVGDRTKSSDFLLYQEGSSGWFLGFRLRGEKGGILVRTYGQLARDLMTLKAEVVGKRVTVWGKITDVPPEGKSRGYQVLDADRVSVPGLPPLPTALTEAPSEPMGFDQLEQLEATPGWPPQQSDEM